MVVQASLSSISFWCIFLEPTWHYQPCNQTMLSNVNHLLHQNDCLKGWHSVTWYPSWDSGIEKGHWGTARQDIIKYGANFLKGVGKEE